jgi:Protein of unknown function (DUF3631)
VLDLLVPRPMHTINATAAAVFRAVEDHQPTLLMDEADTYLGPLARGEHEELRGLINAGHRKGAVAHRCVGDPAKMQVKAFPAFCAVAIAGIGDLPDTILDRGVLIWMRRRGPAEQVEPFRRRKATPQLRELHQALAAWTSEHQDQLAQTEPEMPPGLVDRPADVWEALLAVADLAGGDWPTRARVAAVRLNKERGEADPSLGVKLLADIRTAFDADLADQLATDDLLKRLHAMEESPWGTMPGRGIEAGKPLSARGLGARLRPFDVRPCQYRDDSGARHRGYLRADLADAWSRYLPSPEPSVTPEPAVTAQATATDPGTDAERDSDASEPETAPEPAHNATTSTVTPDSAVTDPQRTARAEPEPLPGNDPGMDRVDLRRWAR